STTWSWRPSACPRPSADSLLCCSDYGTAADYDITTGDTTMFASHSVARALAAGLAALALLPHAAAAEPLPQRNGFPGQPIRFISPFPPGGGNDASTRWVTTR